MLHLEPTAKKAEQLGRINLVSDLVGLLIDFAGGDETALEQAYKLYTKTAGAVHTVTPAAVAAEATANLPVFVEQPPNLGVLPSSDVVVFLGPTTIEAPANSLLTPAQAALVAIPAEMKCTCPMAVKDKDSATHLCLKCGKNAYESHYVFAHTEDGKNILAGKEEPVEEWHSPVEPTFAKADGIEFAPSSEELYEDAEAY